MRVALKRKSTPIVAKGATLTLRLSSLRALPAALKPMHARRMDVWPECAKPGRSVSVAFLTALGVSLIRDSGFLELDLQGVTVCRLEESVPQRAVDFDRASHDGIGLRIVFECHAWIISKARRSGGNFLQIQNN